MRCSTCSYERQPAGAVVCNLCGAPLVATRRVERPEPAPVDPAMAALREQARAQAAERDARIERRRIRKLRAHMVAGVLCTLFTQVVLSFPTSLLEIAIILVFSAIFGSAMGWLINRNGGGMFRGAMIGIGLLAVMIAVLQLIIAGTVSPFTCLAAAAIAGGLPGALIGTHVEIDR